MAQGFANAKRVGYKKRTAKSPACEQTSLARASQTHSSEVAYTHEWRQASPSALSSCWLRRGQYDLRKKPWPGHLPLRAPFIEPGGLFWSLWSASLPYGLVEGKGQFGKASIWRLGLSAPLSVMLMHQASKKTVSVNHGEKKHRLMLGCAISLWLFRSFRQVFQRALY